MKYKEKFKLKATHPRWNKQVTPYDNSNTHIHTHRKTEVVNKKVTITI